MSRKSKQAPVDPVETRLPWDSTAAWAAIGGFLGGAGTLLVSLLSATAESPSPLPLTIALAFIGVLEILCGYAMLRRSRAGWAFFASLNLTLAVATLFGAPKIRDLADISIGSALLPCLACGVLFVLAILDRDQF